MIRGIIEILLILCCSAAAGAATWYVAGIARQITYVTLADGRREERRLPLLFRILLPFTPNLEGVAKSPGMAKSRDRSDAMITTAGYEGLLEGWEFISLKFLVPLLVTPIWCLLWIPATRYLPLNRGRFILLCLVGALIAFYYPASWLKRAVKMRQAKIIRAMPFVLDLLTLSVEAGLDFMSAIQRTTERRTVDPLTEEFMRVVREIQVGTPRRQALRAMSIRIDLPDMRSVVNALVQADELGVSIGSILRIQADQIRDRRFERAEKLANEAPVKLLAPLMICMFPCVFLILLGPVIFQLASAI
ncbi:MAG: type II secretion system F family protein [Lentisphaerae bacterium]|jgi:pilus assembly protein TadC|nr:type II secretion system F family protein [Lentisphaerota bacterium]